MVVVARGVCVAKVGYPTAAVGAHTVGAPAVHWVRRRRCPTKQSQGRHAQWEHANTFMTLEHRASHRRRPEQIAGAGVDAALAGHTAAASDALEIGEPAAPSRQTSSRAVRIVLVAPFALTAHPTIEAGITLAHTASDKRARDRRCMVGAVVGNGALDL